MKEYAELHLKYRPRRLSDVVGQPEAVASLTKMLEKDALPHSILLTGPSGTGKTTLARILARKVGCDETMELHEINMADERGIDDAREIIKQARVMPLAGRARVFICDEIHQSSKKLGGDAQTTLLKVIEEPPSHCYFFGCTTHPDELLPTLRSRMAEVRLSPIADATIAALVHDVALKENKPVTDALCLAIAEAAGGGARDALKLLHQVIDLDEGQQFATIEACTRAKEGKAGDLIRLALYDRNVDWPAIQKCVAGMPKDEDWEGVRWGLLAGAEKVMLQPRGQHGRAYALIQACRDPWYTCRRAGLLASLYEVFQHSKEK